MSNTTDSVSLDQMRQMIIDIATGVPPPESEGGEAARVRARLASQVAEIIARGGIVDLGDGAFD